MPDSQNDHIFMKLALDEAQRAYRESEVPVGAVLVHNGKVIAKAHNQMERKGDATAHAELLVIREGARHFNDWRLLGTTLYTTLEPCAMCAGAILLSRVERLVWGAPDLRHGANGSFIDLFKEDHPTHTVQITQGVLAEEASELMKAFFRQRRLVSK